MIYSFLIHITDVWITFLEKTCNRLEEQSKLDKEIKARIQQLTENISKIKNLLNE